MNLDKKNKYDIEIIESQTPIIIQKNKLNKVITSASNSQVLLGRPSDSIKSFDLVANTITPNIIKDI